MLFGLYMNNLPYTVKSCSIESYVDDTKMHLSFSSKDTDSCLTKITEDFRHTADWCCSNQILINPSKTKLILFGTKPLLSRVKEVIPFLGQVLIPVPSVKDLGITLHSNLSFIDHVNDLTSSLLHVVLD